jgi:peptide/nickel transport system ATP-binding protein/oligopeptide transport system ATP-binding protein
MKPIISVHNLAKYFPVTAGITRRTIGMVKAVDGIGFEIPEGKTFSLIGESGCGKTTTSRLILLLNKPTSGTILFRGENIIGADKDKIREYRRSVQAIFQDPYSSLQPRMRVKDIVAEPLLQNKYLNHREAMERVEEVMTQVRLPGRSKNFPHEFSGGERQRIALARAIAPNPKLIILDEPVSALDVSVRAEVMNNLKRIQDEYGLAYLLIAHNLGTIRYMTETMGVMYLGKIVEIGPGEELFEHPIHPYTEALLKASLPFDPDSRDRVVPLYGEVPSPLNVPTGCAFHMRCYRKRSSCSEERPVLQEVASGHWVACPYVE